MVQWASERAIRRITKLRGVLNSIRFWATPQAAPTPAVLLGLVYAASSCARLNVLRVVHANDAPSRTYTVDEKGDVSPGVTTDFERHLAEAVPELVDRVLPKPRDAEPSTADEVCPHGVAHCPREICAILNVVQGRSFSFSDRLAFRLALITFAYLLVVLLGGSSPARLAGADWLDRQIDDRIEQIKAPNHTAVPMGSLAIRSADDLHEETVELLEAIEEDETDHSLMEVPRFEFAPFGIRKGLYGSSAYRAISSFRLRVFSGRGSPSA